MPYKFPAVDPGVYFLRSGATGLVKIGNSRDVGDRVHWMQRAAAEELTLLRKVPCEDCRRAERMFHEYFEARRMNGEWFRISALEIDEAIAHWNELSKGRGDGESGGES